jgi:hypothetical protein
MKDTDPIVFTRMLLKDGWKEGRKGGIINTISKYSFFYEWHKKKWVT